MNIEDLTYIFKDQLENPDVFFVINEDGIKTVIKHPTNNLDSLLLFLDNFIPDEAITLPRFRKEF